jgi:hypothetical protein
MKRPPFALSALIAAFCAYAALYIARSSFLVGDVRYFTLADDQMISMRYAENLAHGYGLVWNAGGERIEGYTNFLWVVYMAIFHALRISRPVISLCIQASGALFLALNLLVVYRLAERVFRDHGTALLAVAMTAFYIPLDNWAFQGTEVSVITLLVSIGTLWTLESWDRDAIPWRVWMLAGVTTMIRPDMVVFAAVVVAGASVGRKRWMATMASGAAIVGAWIVAETAFRLWYFGDPLPNTYYLKVTGIPAAMKLTRGLFVAGLFLSQLVPLIVAMAVSGRLRRPSRAVVLLLAVFAAQVVYSVSVGGDAWEWWGGSNRFIAIAMPLFFVVAADGAVRVWSGFVGAWQRGVSPLAAPAMVVLTVIGINWLAFSLTADRTLPLKRLLLIVKPYETESDERAVRAGLAVREFTSPDAVVGVVWAGAIPYFSERTSVDLLGKMDRRIAHEPMRDANRGVPWWAAFHPGHMKWDYAYSIGELKPDIIQAPLWPVTDRSLSSQPFLSDYELRSGFSDQRLPDGASLNDRNQSQWFVKKSSPHLQRLAQR